MPLTATIDDVLSWAPCYRYRKADVRRLAGKRKQFTAIQAIRHLYGKIPNEDILWLVLRPELIEEKTLHELSCDFAERALNRERAAGREPHKDLWKAVETKRLWIDGKATDQQLLAASAAARTTAAWDTATAARTAMAAAEAAATAGATATAPRPAATAAAAAAATAAGWVEERDWQLGRVREVIK